MVIISVWSYSYEWLLERALKGLPKKEVERTDRFVMPTAQVMVTGKRTIIQNFKSICTSLNRDSKHLMQYILRELAAPGHVENGVLVIQGERRKEAIDAIIARYVKDYVICPICGRPDTFLTRERRLTFLVCGACGAKSSTRPLVR